MPLAIVLRALIVWSVILVFAIINGAFREGVLIPHIGNPWAQVISGSLLSLWVFVAARIFVARIKPLSTHQYAALGVLWLAMTLIFEFGFGLLRGKSWPEMFTAYQFHDGNLWLLVLLVVAVSPWLAAHWQKRMLP